MVRPLRRLGIALGRQQKVDRLITAVDSSIQIDPAALNLHVSLIHPPGAVVHAQVGADALLQFGRISLDPAKDGGVIHFHAAVHQHPLEIAVADREHQIPSDRRPQDHLGGKLPTFESLMLSYLLCSSPSRHATVSTRLDRQHKDATDPPNTLMEIR
jgi:hypothetical protein